MSIKKYIVAEYDDSPGCVGGEFTDWDDYDKACEEADSLVLEGTPKIGVYILHTVCKRVPVRERVADVPAESATEPKGNRSFASAMKARSAAESLPDLTDYDLKTYLQRRVNADAYKMMESEYVMMCESINALFPFPSETERTTTEPKS